MKVASTSTSITHPFNQGIPAGFHDDVKIAILVW